MSGEITSYSPEIERILEKTISDAGFWLQSAVLGLPREAYENRIVLDIGSGRNNRFANELLEIVEGTAVISVNPLLALEKVCADRGISREAHRRSVAALAQGSLPFRDNSMDTIVSVLGVPNYLITPEVPVFLNEAWRVLAPGGIASFWPFANIKTGDDMLQIDKDFLEIDEVSTEVMAALPQPYRQLSQRIVMTKPIEENLPKEIAQNVAV